MKKDVYKNIEGGTNINSLRDTLEEVNEELEEELKKDKTYPNLSK